MPGSLRTTMPGGVRYPVWQGVLEHAVTTSALLRVERIMDLCKLWTCYLCRALTPASCFRPRIHLLPWEQGGGWWHYHLAGVGWRTSRNTPGKCSQVSENIKEDSGGNRNGRVRTGHIPALTGLGSPAVLAWEPSSPGGEAAVSGGSHTVDHNLSMITSLWCLEIQEVDS